MKQILFLFIVVFSLASCSYTTGSGDIITENRSVRDFTGISVGGDFDVEVRIGPATEVKLEADDNIMRYIETVVSGNTLKIRTRDLHNYHDVHMKVYITTPSLTKISTSASPHDWQCSGLTPIISLRLSLTHSPGSVGRSCHRGDDCNLAHVMTSPSWSTYGTPHDGHVCSLITCNPLGTAPPPDGDAH